jgi:RimJ/RimL family protein N-acetyltransferase
VFSPIENLNNWQPVALPGPVTLSGRHAILEPLSASRHASALWQAVDGHDEVWDWLGDGPYARKEDLTAALHAKEMGTAAQFLAIRPVLSSGEIGEAAGYASLMRMDPANGVIEVGNVMFSPALQRSAAATETIYLMARYIFDDLGYRRFEWKCNALNLPSQRAAGRFGFVFEGIFRQHMIVKGCNRDTAWYSMLDSEWPERKRIFEAWLASENFDSEGLQRRTLISFAERADDITAES